MAQFTKKEIFDPIRQVKLDQSIYFALAWFAERAHSLTCYHEITKDRNKSHNGLFHRLTE